LSVEGTLTGAVGGEGASGDAGSSSWMVMLARAVVLERCGEDNHIYTFPYGLENDYEDKLPENKFLKQYKFVDDEHSQPYILIQDIEKKVNEREIE